MKIKHAVLLVALVALDQISKWWISTQLALGERMEILPGFFDLTYVRNTGSAWSMLEGKMTFFYIVSVIALIVMIYFYRGMEKKDWLAQLGLVAMIAGTIGNFIDRILFQYVRDFLSFCIFGYDFPVFNIADSALCIGVGMILLSVFLESYGGVHKCVK